MRFARWLGLVVPALCLAELAGCSHCCKRSGACCPQRPASPGPMPTTLPPHSLMPMQSGPVQAPPFGSISAPPPGPISSPAPQVPSPPMPVSPVDIRGYGPSTPMEANWQPVPGSGVRLAPPEPSRTESPRAPIRLEQPVISESASSLPVGIPQFAVARDGVTSGLKPSPEGFDWLKANGYRTVLHLHAPGANDTADRQAVERRGMLYLGLSVSPANLAQAVDEFNRTVSNRANEPLFVYDTDGLLAGSLWYLFFRTMDRLPDASARQKAATLGLKETTQGEAGAMWLAIQRYLQGLRP